jgi:hypothetical protein
MLDFDDIVIDPETGLRWGEQTGYDYFLQLRNMFRAYWDAKVNPDLAPYTLMVWQNGKEGEYYVVEPMTFRTNRDAASPLTFNYDIQMRTIDKLDIVRVKKTRSDDIYTKKNGPDGFFVRINQARAQLTRALAVAQQFTAATARIGQAAVTEVLTGVNTVLVALAGLVTAGTSIFSIPRTSLGQVASNALILAEKLQAAGSNVYSSKGILDDYTNAAHAYKNMHSSLIALYSENTLFQDTVATPIGRKVSAYRNADIKQFPLTGGSRTYLANVPPPASAAVTAVNAGETIQQIALRTLGDSGNWKILVLLNKLVPPYISPSGNGKNVLRPGDSILIPSNNAPASVTISQSNVKYTGDSNLDKRIGRDLKLATSKSLGNVNIYDVVVGTSGDLDTVSGADNMKQALISKFSTEPGELPTHSDYGLLSPVGQKATAQTVVEFNLNVRSALLADSRISSVAAVKTSFSGNTIRVYAAPILAGSSDALALDFDVRR